MKTKLQSLARSCPLAQCTHAKSLSATFLLCYWNAPHWACGTPF